MALRGPCRAKSSAAATCPLRRVPIVRPTICPQQAAVAQGSEQPVIEVNGKLQFSLPGQPLFPALADDTVLKPTLSWELLSDKQGAISAEFSYVTGGMNWERAIT